MPTSAAGNKAFAAFTALLPVSVRQPGRPALGFTLIELLVVLALIAIGTAAAIPGTLVNTAAGGAAREAVRFGHPSGTLRVGAEATQHQGQWQVTKASMSRSARVLMEGWVRVPGDVF